MKNTKSSTFLVIFTLIFINLVSGQRIEPENKLLWRISSPDNEQDSYIYGTMHVNDARVFNFSDSVYVKIEECKYFALEVHPDTIVKNLIIDPFNNRINAKLESSFNEEEKSLYEEFIDEVENDINIDLSFFSKESLELLPLLKDKIFRKNKDKNTFLDAHLYHIAKLLNKNIVGLESMEDQFLTLNKIKISEDLEFPDIIKIGEERKRQYKELLETYIAGDVDKLYENGSYEKDSILAYRNHVMANRSIQYIDNGGIFMAVGAAHLSGKEGILNLLKLKGYEVSPVKAIFSKKMLKSELGEMQLDWVTEDYPLEGFKISLPDKAYDYRPESMAGIMEVRTYPDLGGGHFFFYSSVPIMVNDFKLEDIEKELRNNAKKSGMKIGKKNLKYGSYKGRPSLDVDFAFFNQKIKFRYIKQNNYLLILGISPMKGATVDKNILKRYYNSVEFKEIEVNEKGAYISEKGAFKVHNDANPQVYTLYDESYGYKTTIDYSTFFDQKNNLMHMVVCSYEENGDVNEDVSLALTNIEDFFVGEADSLISIQENQRFGGKKLFVLLEDGTFLKGLLFSRGNRFYQVVSSGKSDEKNYQEADVFIENFELINYEDHSLHFLEHKDFTSQFFNKPSIDSNAGLWYIDYESEVLKYHSFDLNSGSVYWVKKKTINPYSTFENVDSCYSEFKKNFVNSGDSIIYTSCNYDPDRLEMNFQLRNKKNQLDKQFKLFFDGENIYELCLIQDSASMHIDFNETFVFSFKLKRTPQKSILLRDSSAIYNSIISDLQETDTIIQLQASNALFTFNFDDVQKENISREYIEQIDLSKNIQFNQNMIRYIFDKNNEAFEKYLVDRYAEIDSEEIRKTIFQLFTERLDDKDIDIVESLVTMKKPKFDNSWELNNILSSHYKQQDKLKPLVPTIIDLGKTDSTFTLTSLFVDLLKNKIVTYDEDLSSISSFIEDKTISLYHKIRSEEESNYSYQYSLVQYASLTSFGNCREELKEVYEHIYKDTSMTYYNLEGAEYLLRCGENVDLSEFYRFDLDKSMVMRLYELQREFKNHEILPDTLMTLEKYITIVGLDYLEQEEYFDSIEIGEIEEIKGKEKTEYFFKCKLIYEDEDEDDDEYSVVVLVIIENVDIHKKPFLIPDFRNVETIYEYINNEEDLNEKKEVLREYIEAGYGY